MDEALKLNHTLEEIDMTLCFMTYKGINDELLCREVRILSKRIFLVLISVEHIIVNHK